MEYGESDVIASNIRQCTSFTGDGLSNWDTSRVTDLSGTFWGAASFNADILHWNVVSIVDFDDTTFGNTFGLQDCEKTFIYESWSSQGLNMSKYYPSWGNLPFCVRSLADSLNRERCFTSSPCSCTFLNPRRLNCPVCGTIPSELGNCVNLTSFSIEETFGTLSGTIPTELGRLVKLTHLDLSGNILEGPIPENLFNMSNLQSLDLHRNNLNGTLSNRIKDLSNLESLVLQHNKLSGEIPESIESCSKLFRLYLSDNKFRGELPSSLPHSLQEIRVDRNDFNGSLPLDTIRNMKHLREFHADRNRLDGAVGDVFSST